MTHFHNRLQEIKTTPARPKRGPRWPRRVVIKDKAKAPNARDVEHIARALDGMGLKNFAAALFALAKTMTK